MSPDNTCACDVDLWSSSSGSDPQWWGIRVVVLCFDRFFSRKSSCDSVLFHKENSDEFGRARYHLDWCHRMLYIIHTIMRALWSRNFRLLLLDVSGSIMSHWLFIGDGGKGWQRNYRWLCVWGKLRPGIWRCWSRKRRSAYFRDHPGFHCSLAKFGMFSNYHFLLGQFDLRSILLEAFLVDIIGMPELRCALGICNSFPNWHFIFFWICDCWCVLWLIVLQFRDILQYCVYLDGIWT